jgi:hypothetical protein
VGQWGKERVTYNELDIEGEYDLLDLLCYLVVRVPSYRPRNPGCDSKRYQTFWEVVGLYGVHSLVKKIEELLERISGDLGL